MHVNEIMIKNPLSCVPETDLATVAHLMAENAYDALPVVNSHGEKEPLGIITDRDIVLRGVTRSRSPETIKVRECMTGPAVLIGQNADLDACCALMEEKQVRHVVVVDEEGKCCGLISEGMVARHVSDDRAASLIRSISTVSGQLAPV